MMPMTTTSWTVSQVRQALKDLETGYLHRAALLADAMTRDDRIGGTLRTRIRALLGLPRSFIPAADNRNAKKTAMALETDWRTIAPSNSIAAMMRWAILLGVSVAEHQWVKLETQGDTSRWVPRLKIWHPQFLSYRWDTRSWWLATQDGPLEIEPNNGQWVVMTLASERPWMEGLVRELAIPYLIRQFAERDWSRYSEVHGLPTKIAKVPLSSTEDDRKLFFRSLSNLGGEAIVKIVQQEQGQPGFDVTLLEATGNSWAGFQGLIRQMDSSIAISVLGQNLTTEVKGGSFAAANVQDKTKQDVLEADAELIMDTINAQTVPWWTSVNVGLPSLIAPRVFIDSTPPEDSKLRAETVSAQAKAVADLKAVGVELQPFLNEFGFQILEPAPNGPDNPQQLKTRMLERLISKGGVQLAKADGFTSGQLHADELGDELLESRVLKSDVTALERIIDEAEDYDDLRTKLLATYKDMKPEELRELMEQATLIANLAGRHAVLEDTR
jgi:phage gp29-like protein